uniref:ABC transporter domain-containing protein n=1 Tax=Pipistrellus kuhlii TaxID=59472 RepID=A0A7J7TNQ2_PIPKU|nr:hypothetical protein mPipKuh1_009311 [Pipistrellus kuhlii]
MKKKKLDALTGEQLNFLLSLVEFLEKLLLPNLLDSSSSPTKTILNATHSWINHSKDLGREPSGIDTHKLLEFGQEVIEKVHTLEKMESSYVLRFMEAVLSEINPKFLELWTYSISKGKRTKFENLSTLSNFSILGNERILSKSFNFSKLFRLDWPELPAVKMDFVHLSESIIHRLYELGFLRQEQVSDVYDFTVLQGIGISHVTKEDFMFVMKTLLDTIELVSDKPGVLAKVVTCLPVVWCRNHTISGFQQNPELEACNGHFYSKMASILDHLQLSPPGEVSQCSNESSRMEITKKMVCVIHELVDWSSILLELSEIFHINASLMKTVQEFRQKVFSFVLSGNQSKDSTSSLCPPVLIKHVALQIIEKFRNVSFTKASSDENILDKLALLNRILNNEGAEASPGNLSLSWGRMIKSLSGDESLENRTRSVVSLLMMFLDANLLRGNFEALSSFIKGSKTAYNFVDLWLESEQAMKDPNLNRRALFSKINEEIPMINSMALQKMTMQLVHILESLNSSLLQLSEMTRDFPSVTKIWLRKYASEEYSRRIQIFFFLMANENSTLTKDINTFLDYLKNISRGGDSHIDLIAQLVNQEQSTNFSVASRLLLKSFLVNAINNLAAGSQQAAWNLSDTDLQVLNLINLTLNQTPLEKGERILLPPGGMVEFMGQLLKTFFTFVEKENSENKTSLLLKDLHNMFAEISSANQLSHQLQAALRLLREASAEMAAVMDSLFNSPREDFRASCPSLREAMFANLTNLLSFMSHSFPLRNIAALDITKRLLGVISRAGGGSPVWEPLLEMSGTLGMLVSATVEMQDLAASVNSTVELLQLAKKVSRKMATVFETHHVSGTSGTIKFFDTLYSILQQNVGNVVNEITALKKGDQLVFENINDLLMPLLDLAFGMNGIKPNISQDSGIFRMSSSILSYVNQSREFSDISEEIAEFLTSGEINLGDMEHLLVAINNGTQIFSLDSVNVWEEILDCLISINNITKQIDFLCPNPVSTHGFPQDAREMALVLDELLSRDRTEVGPYWRMVTDLAVALWSPLEKDDLNVSNLWLTLAPHADTLLEAAGTVEEFAHGGHGRGAPAFSSPLMRAATQLLEEAARSALSGAALLRKGLLLNNPQGVSSTRTVLQPVLEMFLHAAAGKNIPPGRGEKAERERMIVADSLTPSPWFENCVKGLIALTESWQEVLADESVARMCQDSQQPSEPPAAAETPRRARMLLRVLPTLTDVRVKDLVKNITAFTEELRSAHLSPEAISSILEANISCSQVLSGALTLALSGRCDQDVLRLLLASPEDGKARLAAKELCGLPGASVYSLLASVSRHLDLRSFVYKTLMPAEAQGVLSSLLAVVSRLSHLLPRASHVLEHLPQFLHTPNIMALLDLPAARQASPGAPASSSALGSFQAVVTMVCQEQESFLSNSNMFLNLPRVNELLESDKEKFNIPEDSTPFCLKLYQEILRSPNGALVWAFLRPVLHGKILYAPSTPEVDEVIRKANHTFVYVDKLRALSETLLSVASSSQSGGRGRTLGQLQEVLRSKFIRNFVESQLHINVDKLTEKLQTYAGGLGQMLSRLGTADLLSLGPALVNLSSCVLLDRFQGLPSAAALEAAAPGLMRQNRLLASVIFNTSGRRRSGPHAPPLPPRVAYTIRTSLLYSVQTDQAENPFWKFHPQSLPADGFKYNYVFAPLQDMLERALLRVQTRRENVGPSAQAQPIPYPCHSSDLFLNHVGFFLPLIMMLTWVVSVASMVRRRVYEREIQMEEYLRMMGAPPAASLLAWFLENMAVVAVGSAALAVVLKASGIFAHSDALILFLFLLAFGVSAVTLSYLLSACFSRAAPAALCGSLLYLASFLPYIVLLVLRGRLSAPAQMLLCLLSTTAFGQGVYFVTFLEGQEAGVQWGNLYQPSEQAGLALGWVCVMILVDSGLYFLCGWYLSNLVPGAVGFRKPWYFPFTASYWRGARGLATRRPCARGSGPLSLREDAGHTGSLPQRGNGEREGGPPGVTLVSVTKEYQPHRAAVRDLTLTFHRGQITALLGANGAGKTTIMSLVTGLQAPTSGTVLVDGRNVHTDLAAVRKELGVCPQRDALWDRLTAREHLLLFAAIRSPQWSRAERRQQVDQALRDVGLMPHQHQQARALSGGLRRRLSIGAAFLGSPRTVVLDEPTSGVDPCSRRSIWDILLRYREGRTIILTTHHLDEAEALSDRVAVLQGGRLRCCGAPLGLTEAYGRGLRLTLTQQPSPPERDGPPDAAPTTALIQTHVPGAFLRARSGHTLTYALPEDADRAAFRGLFRALEQDRRRLRLAGCGLADATLEEVFLTLLHDPSDPSEQLDAAPGTGLEVQRPRPPGPTPSYHYGAPASALTQVAALLTQRLCRTRRAWRGALCDLLLPVLFVALAMSLFLVRPLATDYPALQLTPGRFGKAETSFFRTNASCWRPEPPSRPGAPGSCGCRRWQSCPNASARAPALTDRRGHTLLNLSAVRPEEYLLAPAESPRLGGWSFGGRGPDPAQEAHSHRPKPERLAKVWYSQKAFHALPAYLNHLSNLLLWRLLPPAEDWTQYGITLYSHPYGGALLNEDKILESVRQCGVALCIVLGVSVLAAAIGSSVVRDRVSGAKRLQHLSGLGYGAYWLSHFLYDMLFYLVSVGLCVAVVAAFRLPAFTFRENLAATVLLLVLFGYATLPGMYLTSRLFPSADGAFIAYVSLHFVLGLCTLLMTTMPRLLAVVTGAQNLQAIYEVLKWVFTLFPQFCLGQGLIELCYNQIQFDLTRGLGVDTYASPFRMSFLGWVFVQLAAQGTALLLLRLLLHGDMVRRARRHSAVQGTVTACGDADVEAEQARVLKGRTGGDLLVLCNLSKSYGCRRPAVRDVTLGLRSGECFGLLGVNGAGKSTTFKMLSGDEAPSAGHAVVRTPAGEAVPLFAAGAAGVRVGYCPQQDALDGPLTGWEHLRYYCRLRGVPGPRVPQVAGDLVRRLHLEAHVDQPVATYSGGTRRKLSAALALLGKPHLLLLDEPSSGMDPRSKRFLWKAITEEVREGCAVVLTSHSMEECEALCTRLAIMVDGSFRCLGTPQHIKDRFGAGHTVRVGLSAGGSQRELSEHLQRRFPGARLKGRRPNVLEYQVPADWAGLADLLQELEDSKAAGRIRHYALAPASLEQVFVDFAAEQQPAPPAPPEPPARGHQPPPLPV